MYYETYFLDKWRKDVTEFGAKRWNQDKAGPAKLEGNTLHSRALFPIWRVMIADNSLGG